MYIRRRTSHPALRSLVRSFEERRATLGPEGLTWPLTARPHQIIDIYLGDPFRVRTDGSSLQTAPEMVVVGPQGSRRIHLHMSGEVHVFNILLQPAALNSLVGVRAAPDFASRIAAAERWFGMMQDEGSVQDGIGYTSRLLLASRGRVRIAQLVKQSGLSARHFQRRFVSQVGLSPKLYARTIRFDAALTAHRNEPMKSWTQIAHEAGYFDQAHFIRECHALVGVGPSHFIGDWDNILSPDG